MTDITIEEHNVACDVVTPLARIRWGEYRFRVHDADEERFDLICSDGTGTRRELERDEVAHLVATKAIVIEHNHFNVDGTVATNPIDMAFASAPLADQVDALDAQGWCQLLEPDYDAGDAKLYSSELEVLPDGSLALNHWIKKNLSIHNQRMAAIRRIADPTLPKKPRKGQPTYDVHPPGVTQLKANFRKFRAPGYNIVQFLKRSANCGSGSKLAPETKMVMADVCNQLFARNTRFSPSEVLKQIAAELTEKAGKTVKGPCLETLARFLSTWDQGRLMLTRFGFKKAREVKGSNAQGPKYTRMGEMVMMDCWKVDIVVLLKRCGIWMNLSRAQKREWGLRRRVWICVAIDAATRVILGLALGLSESPELTRRVLRMIGSDKSDEAEVAGCRVPPPEPIGIEVLRTDSGIAFRHGFFVSSALTVVDQLKVGIVGKPWRNGPMERFWRTPKEQLLPYFSGLTFGNPQARGDFDAMADASVTLDTFGNALFHFFNDVYRLREHRGLQGQPPLNRAEETVAATGTKKPPSDDLNLVAYGLEVELPLTSQGLTANGIEYKAVWLGTIFSSRKPTTMRVKIDPRNVGRIAVMWEGAWQIVDGPQEFDGIGLTALKRTKAEMSRRYGAQAAVNFPIVAKALLDIRALGASARAEAKMLDMTYDNAKLALEAESLRLRVIYRPTPAQHNASRLISRGAFGKGFATGGSGEAELSDDGGDLFDPNVDLAEIKADDPMADPAVETAYVAEDPEADDGDVSGSDAPAAEAEPALAKPTKSPKRPSASLAITTFADLLKSRKKD